MYFPEDFSQQKQITTLMFYVNSNIETSIINQEICIYMYIKICKTGQYHIKEWEDTYFQNSACIEQI